jgi:hypothetical protein
MYSHSRYSRLADGSIGALQWAQSVGGTDNFDLHLVTSDRTGRAWSQPRPTGIPAQTSWLADLGQAHDRAVADEGLDARQFVATELDDVVLRGVLRGDRVEHAADQKRVRSGGVGSGASPSPGGRHRAVGQPCRPEVTREPDHFGAEGGVVEPRTGLDLRGGHPALQRVAQLLAEQLTSQATLALARRQDDVAEVRLECPE